MGHHYKIRYTIECGDFSEEDAKEYGVGLTDNIIIISCLESPDGSYSQYHVSMMGETQKPMDLLYLWKAWGMFTAMLKDAPLPPDRKRIAEKSFKMIQKFILANRSN